MKRFAIAIIFGLSVFCIFAQPFDNSIESYNKRFLSLNKNMTLLKIHNACIIYDKAYYVVNTDNIKKDIIIDTTKSILYYVGKNESLSRMIISYDSGPRGKDDSFLVTVDENAVISGNELCLSSTAIYSLNKIGKAYIVEKADLSQNEIKRINQPFYLIEFESITNTDIKIYSEIGSMEVVGIIAAGTDVRIIGYKYINSDENTGISGDWFIITGKTGICGWHKPFFVKTENNYQGIEHRNKDYYSLDILDNEYLDNAG